MRDLAVVCLTFLSLALPASARMGAPAPGPWGEGNHWAPAIENITSWKNTHQASTLLPSRSLPYYHALEFINPYSPQGETALAPLYGSIGRLSPMEALWLRDYMESVLTILNNGTLNDAPLLARALGVVSGAYREPSRGISEEDARRMAAMLDDARLEAAPQAAREARRIVAALKKDGHPRSRRELRSSIVRAQVAADQLLGFAFYGPKTDELAAAASDHLEALQDDWAARWGGKALPARGLLVLTPGVTFKLPGGGKVSAKSRKAPRKKKS